MASGREFDKPALYEIRVKGTVDPSWASYWFGDLKVTHLPDGESLLTGQVVDQSALLGLLAQMRDLGLPLLSITQSSMSRYQRRIRNVEKTMNSTRVAPHRSIAGMELSRAGVFYLLSYAISWSCWMLLIAFPQLDRSPRVLWRVGMFGPFLAAIATALIYGGRGGLWAWLKAAFRWRISVLWYLMGGLILPVGIAIVHVGVYLLVGGQLEMASDPPWYYVVAVFPLNVLIAAPIGSGMGEETGWQGSAMPRLVKRLHPLLACAIHGVLWAAWHLPAFWTSWIGKEPLGWFFAYVIPLSMISFWLTRKAKGSVIPAVLLHSSTNLYSSYFTSDMIFANTLAAGFTPIKTVVYAAVAIVLIIATRGRLGYSRTEGK